MWSVHPATEELLPAVHPDARHVCDAQNRLPGAQSLLHVPPVGAGRLQCVRLVARRTGKVGAGSTGGRSALLSGCAYSTLTPHLSYVLLAAPGV